MKPKIWHLWDNWFCAYFNMPWTDAVGCGDTPKEAYNDWKAKNNK